MCCHLPHKSPKYLIHNGALSSKAGGSLHNYGSKHLLVNVTCKSRRRKSSEYQIDPPDIEIFIIVSLVFPDWSFRYRQNYEIVITTSSCGGIWPPSCFISLVTHECFIIASAVSLSDGSTASIFEIRSLKLWSNLNSSSLAAE